MPLRKSAYFLPVQRRLLPIKEKCLKHSNCIQLILKYAKGQSFGIMLCFLFLFPLITSDNILK